MASSVRPEINFSVAPELTVAFVTRKGAYGTIGHDMRELKSWLDSAGIQSTGHPFCLYYDNPSETPTQELRSEACIPVSAHFNPVGRYMVKDLPQVDVAETRHHGPPEKFAQTYGPFLEWLLNNGYNILGPAREYYESVSYVTGPGAGFLIQQPVSKK